MDYTEENSEKILKIWKKDKLNNEMIWKILRKIMKRYGKYGRKLWNDVENTDENSEKIGKISKNIVEWFGKYGRK